MQDFTEQSRLDTMDSERPTISLCYSFVVHVAHGFWFCSPVVLFVSMWQEQWVRVEEVQWRAKALFWILWCITSMSFPGALSHGVLKFIRLLSWKWCKPLWKCQVVFRKLFLWREGKYNMAHKHLFPKCLILKCNLILPGALIYMQWFSLQQPE